MIVEAILSLTSIMLFVVAIAIYPSSATCPPGTYLGEGIRRTGDFACYSTITACCGEPKGPCEGIPCPEQKIERSRIYCTGGSRPIVVDYRSVGCQR